MPPKYSKLYTGPYTKVTGAAAKPTGKKIIKKKASASVQKKGKVKKKTLQTRQRPLGVVENFIVVWLDSNISSSNKDYRNSITKLRRIVNSIKTFTNMNECVTFLNQINNEKLFMIVSGFLGEQIVPFIEKLSHLNSIYVFCHDRSKHQLWARKYRKIKDVFTDIEPLCELLKHDIRQCDNNLMSISILSKTDSPTHNLNVLDPSFMYSKLLKEILIQIEHDNQAKTNLVQFCSDQYGDNQKELKSIDEFNKTYSSSSAIWWYTRECFTYTMLNKALRTQDIEIIIKMGFFVRDLHQQIEQLHSKVNPREILTVYRGQGMMNDEFERLLKCQGGLLSFNNFLSTSNDRQVALDFARRAQNDPDVTPIFFQMEINPSISSTPFASIGNQSYYSDKEKEILFSMHTVFRIQEIKQIKEGIWKVSLRLTDDNDEQLQKLTDHMRNETSDTNGWHRLGSLMMAMGQFDKAEEFYKSAFEMTLDNDWKELVHLNYQLGCVYDEKGDLENALVHYEEARDIQLDNLPSDDPSLSMTYTGIGSVLHSQYEFDEALEHFQHALNIALRDPHPDKLKIATIHSYIGGVFHKQHEHEQALNSYQQSLSIRQKHLPPVHSLLATTYNNIGLVYESMNDNATALSYYEKTLAIELKSLPSNHPSLAVTYHNMSVVLDRLYRSQEAVEHQIRAVDIRVMRQAASALKKTNQNLDVDQVHHLIDDLAEQHNVAEEIANAISSPVGSSDLYNDADLERELELLAQEEIKEDMMKIGPLPDDLFKQERLKLINNQMNYVNLKHEHNKIIIFLRIFLFALVLNFFFFC